MKNSPGKKKAAPSKTTKRRTSLKKPARKQLPAATETLSKFINEILVPVDFSGYSKNALRYAIPLAQQYGARLHLVYVIEPTIYPADLGFGQVVMPGVEEEIRTKSDHELQSLIREEIGNRVKADATVRLGKPHQEILKEAEEKNIDLIIIATHGHTGVEQILFGSTAMRVVRLAKCPVLTVRPLSE
ncbi:MAG: universal stress protein [Bacteroidetes bacterium]|nr:universal stress protein [Bacteroidota bacterium]MCW5894175.1 universal stress protein [Bacteroidota bacterium]